MYFLALVLLLLQEVKCIVELLAVPMTFDPSLANTESVVGSVAK